jgi:hypothetical protein
LLHHPARSVCPERALMKKLNAFELGRWVAAIAPTVIYQSVGLWCLIPFFAFAFFLIAYQNQQAKKAWAERDARDREWLLAKEEARIKSLKKGVFCEIN